MKNTHRAAPARKTAKSAAARPTPRPAGASATFTFPGSEEGLHEFTALVVSIRAAESLKPVLEALDLTLERFGELLSATPQLQRTRTHVSKPYASMLCAGKRVVSPRMLKAIELVIGQQLTDIAGEPIGLRITKNSPWHFALGKICGTHGPYEIDGRRRRCPKCVK